MGAVRPPRRRRDVAAGGHAGPAGRRPRDGAALRSLTRGARLLLVAYLLVPAAFTLFGAPSAETDVLGRVLRAALQALTPLSEQALGQAEVELVANALLFLPLGVLLVPAFPRAPLTLLLAVPVLASLGLEVAQLLVVEGRVPDAVDVIANSAGGAVGLLVGADLVRLVSGVHTGDTGR